MLKTFKDSLRIRYTYKTNRAIYLLKKSILGNLLPKNLYSSKSTKIIGTIIGLISSIISIFGSKFLIMGMIILLILYLANQGIYLQTENTFFNILFFSITCEAFAQSNLFEKKEYDYYATMFLKIDTKKYTLINYYWKMILRIISFIIAFIALEKIIKIPIYVGVLLSFYSVMLKTFINYLRTKEFKKEKNIIRILTFPIAFILLVCAIGFPVLNIVIPYNIIQIIIISSFGLGIVGITGLAIFKDYHKMNKKEFEKEFNPELNKIRVLKTIDKKEEKNNKEYTIEYSKLSENGNKYLNKLFLKRNKKKIISRIIISVINLLLIFLLFISFFPSSDEIKENTNESIKTIIVIAIFYSFFVSYFISSKFTELFFEKCDRAMLTFKSYKTNSNINELFKERTKSILIINSILAFIMGIITIITMSLIGYKSLIIENIIIILNILILGWLTTINSLFIYYYVQPLTYNKVLKNVKNTRPILEIISFMFMIIPFLTIYINVKVGLLVTLWLSVMIIIIELSITLPII